MLIGAIDDPPGLREYRFERRAQLGIGRLHPTWAVHQGIEFDEGQVKPSASSRPSVVLPFPLALAMMASLIGALPPRQLCSERVISG